jgi:hypothetical protein
MWERKRTRVNAGRGSDVRATARLSVLGVVRDPSSERSRTGFRAGGAGVVEGPEPERRRPNSARDAVAATKWQTRSVGRVNRRARQCASTSQKVSSPGQTRSASCASARRGGGLRVERPPAVERLRREPRGRYAAPAFRRAAVLGFAFPTLFLSASIKSTTFSSAPGAAFLTANFFFDDRSFVSA